MSKCRETYYIYLDADMKDCITLYCDLDEHEAMLPLHLDRFYGIEWRKASDDPIPVQSTRTAKPDKPTSMKKSLPLPVRNLVLS